MMKRHFLMLCAAFISCSELPINQNSNTPKKEEIEGFVDQLGSIMQNNPNNDPVFTFSQTNTVAFVSILFATPQCTPDLFQKNIETCRQIGQGYINNIDKVILLYQEAQKTEPSCKQLIGTNKLSQIMKLAMICGQQMFRNANSQNTPSNQSPTPGPLPPPIQSDLPKVGFFLSSYREVFRSSGNIVGHEIHTYYQDLKRLGVDSVIQLGNIYNPPPNFIEESEQAARAGLKSFIWLESVFKGFHYDHLKDTNMVIKDAMGSNCMDKEEKFYANITLPAVRQELIQAILNTVRKSGPHLSGLVFDDHLGLDFDPNRSRCEATAYTTTLTNFVNEMTVALKNERPSLILVLTHHPIAFARKLAADWYTWQGFDIKFVQAYILEHWSQYMDGIQKGHYQGLVTLVSDQFPRFPLKQGIEKFCFLKKNGIPVLGYQNFNHNRALYWQTLKQCD